tara:strand:- start:210 stop:593 length:384 start_codon:yes stop_codon:yes gene_type:complete
MNENKKSALTLNSKKLEKLTMQTSKGKSGKAINIINCLLNDFTNEERLRGVSAKAIADKLGITSKVVRGTFRSVFNVGKPSENNNYLPFNSAVVQDKEYAVGITLQPTIHYTLMTDSKEVDKFSSSL